MRLVHCVLLVAAALLASCTEASNPVGFTPNDKDVKAGKDTAVVPDTAKLPDSTPLSGADTDEDTSDEDVPTPDEFGKPCTVGDDCPSGFCVPSAAGLVCTTFCIDECPAGWECRFVGVGGADAQYICVQRALNLCRPCTEHSECVAIEGAFSDRCVSYGKVEGSFCGIACAGPTDCPDGYQCVDVELAGGDGETALQCVPVSGQCECSQLAISEGATTTCLTVNALGKCSGERHCTLTGLTNCNADEAVGEVCNGADDDCDGLTDEELTGTTCDLKNAFGTCKGETFCNGGVPTCSGVEADPESCDNIDNDCDGETDDGFLDSDQDGTRDCVDADDDDDGWPDLSDDCPTTFDPDQLNTDEDKLGNACDEDDDNDTIPDTLDNCQVAKNPSQLDQDDDTLGDACDTDIDGDLVLNEIDNCEAAHNPDQANFDEDLAGDSCDGDDDDDQIVD